MALRCCSSPNSVQEIIIGWLKWKLVDFTDFNYLMGYPPYSSVGIARGIDADNMRQTIADRCLLKVNSRHAWLDGLRRWRIWLSRAVGGPHRLWLRSASAARAFNNQETLGRHRQTLNYKRPTSVFWVVNCQRRLSKPSEPPCKSITGLIRIELITRAIGTQNGHWQYGWHNARRRTKVTGLFWRIFHWITTQQNFSLISLYGQDTAQQVAPISADVTCMPHCLLDKVTNWAGWPS